MRILVAGATGAVGRALIPKLVASGHIVTGLTRSAEKAAWIRQAGASPVVANALDAEAVRAAVRAADPDVIVHQMTALSGMTDLRKFDSAFAASNRLRTKGLDHLLVAAKETRVRRIVVQSYCGWPYARTGALIKSEEDPLDPDPPKELKRTLDAIRYLERATLASEMDGIVLRYGTFYGHDTGMLAQPNIDVLRRRQFPLIGDGSGYWSFLDVEDAASAAAIAVEHGGPGVYNIVDDEPAPVSEWLPVLAAAAGAKPPLRVPKWLARILIGDHLVQMMTEGRAGSNAKARRELGWEPSRKSWRQGFPALLGSACRT